MFRTRVRLALLGGAVIVAGLVTAGGFALRSRGSGEAASVVVPKEAATLYRSAATNRTATDTQIETLQSYLSKRTDEPVLFARLGGAYLQKARETGDPTWYAKAEAVLNRSLALAPDNNDALSGLGALALSRHQFSAALDLGKRAVTVNPYRAANWGIISDALIELGRYDEAMIAVQKMVDTRPDLSSYARVSYIRELNGKVDGAIIAMQQAVNAGGPAPENTAYVRVQLANLYFNSGRVDEAEQQYGYTLQRLPKYGPALAGMAYVKAARGDDPAAIVLMQQAVEATPLPEHLIALADLYTRAGRTGEAVRQQELVRTVQRLYQSSGTDVDVELALFEADRGPDPATAVALARAGYERRPSIHAADALAWALYRAGNAEQALPYAREALRLGTKDALKLYHAGMVARATGDTAQARAWLEEALTINPNFSLLYAGDARQTLALLGGTPPAGTTARSPLGN